MNLRFSNDATGCTRLLSRRRPSGPVWLAVVSTLAWSGAARAEFHFSPFGSVTDEYNSNIFYIAPGAQETDSRNGPAKADNVITTRLGADLTYAWSQQKLHATVQGGRLDYNHFTDQSHNEYLLDGGLDWKITDLLDGTLDYRRTRHQVAYYLLAAGSNSLEQETDNVGTVGINLNITPVWRLETLGTVTDDDTPRQFVPGYQQTMLDLSTHERYGQASLRYLGVANLSAGLQYGYLNGTFNGEPAGISPHYVQNTEQLVAKYVVSGLTTLDAAAGYARRTQGSESIGGFAGLLGYTRQLTGKTSVNLQVSRVMQTYVSTIGTEIDTSAQLGFSWQATDKINVSPSYVWTYSTFPGQAIANGPDRGDHLQNLNLDVTYQALRWLSLHPYVRYQTRNSSSRAYDYNVSIVGLTVEARLP